MSVIDLYLNKVTPSQRDQLERVRGIVRQIIPEADEVISYGMPVFKLKGKYIIGMAAFKNHLSLFPGSEPIEELRDKLGEYKLSKGTIQFTEEHPIPEALIKKIIAGCLSRIPKY